MYKEWLGFWVWGARIKAWGSRFRVEGFWMDVLQGSKNPKPEDSKTQQAPKEEFLKI